MADLFLTDVQIADLCKPLTQAAAQIRYLRDLGLTVTVKPNGRPAVVRSHAEQVLSGQAAPAPTSAPEKTNIATPRPNVDAFMKVIQGGRKHGTQKKLESA